MSFKGKMDEISERLESLEGDIPKPRTSLTLAEKIQLVKDAGGPKTVASILKAKKDFAMERIPWLFNSINTQVVVDIINNEMDEALKTFPDKKKQQKP